MLCSVKCVMWGLWCARVCSSLKVHTLRQKFVLVFCETWPTFCAIQPIRQHVALPHGGPWYALHVSYMSSTGDSIPEQRGAQVAAIPRNQVVDHGQLRVGLVAEVCVPAGPQPPHDQQQLLRHRGGQHGVGPDRQPSGAVCEAWGRGDGASEHPPRRRW